MSLCTERVNRGDGRWVNMQPCGREAVEDGLCKIHLRARNKRQEKSREWDAKSKRGRELQKEAERLSEILGTDVSPNYSTFTSHYTEHMVVPLDWIQALAKERTT